MCWNPVWQTFTSVQNSTHVNKQTSKHSQKRWLVVVTLCPHCLWAQRSWLCFYRSTPSYVTPVLGLMFQVSVLYLSIYFSDSFWLFLSSFKLKYLNFLLVTFSHQARYFSLKAGLCSISMLYCIVIWDEISWQVLDSVCIEIRHKCLFLVEKASLKWCDFLNLPISVLFSLFFYLPLPTYSTLLMIIYHKISLG